MITPLDIQNKEFSKAVRGYKDEEVDGFLDLISFDLERLMTENASLKSDVDRLERELNRYRGSEGVVLETLEAAKALMGDICQSAERRAEILLKNAELDAELIQREAKESVERLTEESIELKNRFNSFQTKYRALLESELERFDGLSMKIFGEFKADDPLASKEKESAFPDWGAINDSSKTRVIKTVNDEEMTKTLLNIRIGDED